MNSNKEHRFREIIIPGDVLEDERLSDGAKIMYGKIARLSQADGRCWSSNSFLDGTKSGRNASRFIAELKETEYILIENEKSRLRKIIICGIESRINPANSGEVEKSGEFDLANSGEVEKSGEFDLANFGDVEKSGEVNPANSGDVNRPESANLANSGEVDRPETANLANSGEVDRPETANLAKFGDRTSSSSSNKTTTTAGPPEDEGVPTVEKVVAAHTFISREDLRKALYALDKKLVLGDNFYAKAPPFLFKNGLGLDYASWIYEKSVLAQPDSLNNYFYTVFFLQNKVEEYKAAEPPEQEADAELPLLPLRSCPVCGTECDAETDFCPACGLHRPYFNNNPGDLLRSRVLHELPPDKRGEYLSREKAVYAECGFSFENAKFGYDFEKMKNMLAGLKAEFGFEAAGV